MKVGLEVVDDKIARLEWQLEELRSHGSQTNLVPNTQLRTVSSQSPSTKASLGTPGSQNEILESEYQANFPATQYSPSISDTVSNHIHALLQTEAGLSAYGPASVLHVRPSSESTMTIGCNTHEGIDSSSKQRLTIDDRTRQQLFAYSALEYQKEQTYMLEKKYDLDGVDWEVADHLLDLHWNHHHLGFPLTYRPTIMHSLATNGPYCNKLLLLSIFYSSALQSSRPNMQDDSSHPEYYGTRFFERFMSLMPTHLHTSSTASISAFLTMSSACVSNGWQTVGWLFAGIAYRTIVDLGVNPNPDRTHVTSLVPNESRTQMTAVDVEIQRRYVWAAYLVDSFHSLYFGRPPALSIPEGLEPLDTLLDTYEELEIWKPYVDPESTDGPVNFTPQPARAISTRNALLILARIASQITTCFYGPEACKLTAAKARSEVCNVQLMLEGDLADVGVGP